MSVRPIPPAGGGAASAERRRIVLDNKAYRARLPRRNRPWYQSTDLLIRERRNLLAAQSAPGRVIAFGNLKGGTGKTTLCVSVGCALAAHGPVVVIDADAQGTATSWAASGHLPARVVALPIQGDGAKALKDWLGQVIALKAGAAYVAIDLPPNLGSVANAALSIADLFVVPVTPSGMDLQATSRALDLLRQARQARGGAKPECLLVPSRVDRRSSAGKEIEGVLSDFREPVAPAVAQRAAHVDAFSAGRWIGDYAARSAGHVEIEALAAMVRRIASR